MTLEDQIRKTIGKKDRDWAFCISDFVGEGDYKSIAKALERMTDKKLARRILPGIYDIPSYNKTLNVAIPPDIESVAEAIARNNCWNILPSGNVSLLAFGLTTQVPADYCYICDGMYKKYDVFGTVIEFKKASLSKFKPLKKNGTLFQALKTMGNGRITERDIAKLKNQFDEKEKIKLIGDMKYAPRWMHSYIKEIGEAPYV